MPYHYDAYFWISVVGAVIVKMLLGENHTFRRSFATGLAGIWFAWTFTIPVVDFVDWNSDTYSIGVAGLLTLTGEGFARQLINAFDDPKIVKSIVRKFLGLPQPVEHNSDHKKAGDDDAK